MSQGKAREERGRRKERRRNACTAKGLFYPYTREERLILHAHACSAQRPRPLVAAAARLSAASAARVRALTPSAGCPGAPLLSVPRPSPPVACCCCSCCCRNALPAAVLLGRGAAAGTPRLAARCARASAARTAGASGEGEPSDVESSATPPPPKARAELLRGGPVGPAVRRGGAAAAAVRELARAPFHCLRGELSHACTVSAGVGAHKPHSVPAGDWRCTQPPPRRSPSLPD